MRKKGLMLGQVLKKPLSIKLQYLILSKLMTHDSIFFCWQLLERLHLNIGN
jgi:hypothetical protein